MEKICNGRALYTEKDKIWIAKGLTFYAIDFNGKRISKKYTVGNLKQKLIASNRLSRQLLREGIHHLIPLNDGNFLVSTKKKTFTIGTNNEIVSIFEGYIGNKPGHQGICKTLDGTVFFGEYSLNTKRQNQTSLYRSIDNAKTFEKVLTFNGNEVRHIHFVKYDPFEKCLWLGTGDKDFECKLLRSDDNGCTWQCVGEGSQDWRAIGVCFTKDKLVWGTDAGSVPDQNHIIEFDRQSHELKVVDNLEGPCHGCCSLENGTIYLSTGVEGGENEKDRFARLKTVIDGKYKTIYKCKKDVLPLILQYGVMRFSLGTENTDKLVFTMYALNGTGEAVIGL